MRWHIETEYREGGLANISAYPTQQAAWDYLKRSIAQRERHKEEILVSSLLDTDDSDEDPLTRIAVLEELEARYRHHVRPCDGHPHCTACWDAGLIGEEQ